MDLEKWLADWTACVDGIFGERIRFLGIQGSYGRGEATAESDIDVVLLLDGLQLEDLQAYDEAVSALPMREKLCGFVGGWEELIHWDKADLFQFIQDTRALRGSLMTFVMKSQKRTSSGQFIKALVTCTMAVSTISFMKKAEKC